DWSSDVCSSDLDGVERVLGRAAGEQSLAHDADQGLVVAAQRLLAPLELVLEQADADQLGDRAAERLVLDRPRAAVAIVAERDVVLQPAGPLDDRGEAGRDLD